MNRRNWLAFALAASSTLSRSAHAASACDGTLPWVRVELRGDAWTTAQRTRVLADLQHGLSPQGIDVCLQAPSPPATALAELKIELRGSDKASVEILLQDSVTHKRVARELDLEPIPADGRELAIAIEADELLRASWAEVLLDTERSRRAKPRREVVKSVDQVLSPARSRNSSVLEARLAGEYFSGGTTLLGAEAAGRIPLATRLDLELAAGVRLGPAETAPHGSVSALGLGGGARFLLRLVGDSSASLHAGAGFALSRLEFRGNAARGASSSSYADWLAVARANLLARVALGRVLGLSGGISAGAALHSVEATDAGTTVAAARGLELGATFGLEAR